MIKNQGTTCDEMLARFWLTIQDHGNGRALTTTPDLIYLSRGSNKDAGN